MKVTITFESTMNEDGEDAVVSFSKEDIQTVEDSLNAMGRALYAGGYTYVNSLQAGTDDGTKFYVEF